VATSATPGPDWRHERVDADFAAGHSDDVCVGVGESGLEMIDQLAFYAGECFYPAFPAFLLVF